MDGGAMQGNRVRACLAVWQRCQGQGCLGFAHSQCLRSLMALVGLPRIHFPLFQ